jgi:L,D-transpeptidase ErfK/SrfK
MTTFTPTRRRVLLGAAAAFAAPAVLRAETAPRNVSSFRAQRWQDHFDTLGVATIVADTQSRALHFWSADGTDYRVYPTSVPLTEELTRRGYTEVVRKRVAPDWTPTESMKERDPTLPDYMPPGPGQPARHPCDVPDMARLPDPWHARHAQDRAAESSSGCIGLYNQHIAELFEMTEIGTQVRVI